MKTTTLDPSKSIEVLKKRWRYDEKKGILFRYASGFKLVTAGKKSEFGYLVMSINGQTVMVHRAIWLLHYGNWPKYQIDHINGNKTDNRIENMRDVQQVVNMQNQTAPHKNNKSGYLGVSFHKQKEQFCSQIRIDGVLLTIGYFKTAKEAHDAYLSKKTEVHPGAVFANKSKNQRLTSLQKRATEQAPYKP